MRRVKAVAGLPGQKAKALYEKWLRSAMLR